MMNIMKRIKSQNININNIIGINNSNNIRAFSSNASKNKYDVVIVGGGIS